MLVRHSKTVTLVSPQSGANYTLSLNLGDSLKDLRQLVLTQLRLPETAILLLEDELKRAHIHSDADEVSLFGFKSFDFISCL